MDAEVRLFQTTLKKALVPFIFWVGHHKMISNHQNENEDAEEIGKESQVLIVNHLHNISKSPKSITESDVNFGRLALYKIYNS